MALLSNALSGLMNDDWHLPQTVLLPLQSLLFSSFQFVTQTIRPPCAFHPVAIRLSPQKAIGIPFGSLDASNQRDDIQIISCLFIPDMNG
jgi:hypothetical protein